MKPEEILNQLTITLLQLQLDVKLAHWKTRIYAKHIALGDYYDFLSDKMDHIIEVTMGQLNDRINLSNINLVSKNENIEIVDITEHINKLKPIYETLSKMDFTFQSIVNILDEIIGESLKVKYLLSQK
jgi:DNA-binding ferritin-like protein